MVTPSLHAIIGCGGVSVGSSYPAIAGRFWLERASGRRESPSGLERRKLTRLHCLAWQDYMRTA